MGWGGIAAQQTPTVEFTSTIVAGNKAATVVKPDLDTRSPRQFVLGSDPRFIDAGANGPTTELLSPRQRVQ